MSPSIFGQPGTKFVMLRHTFFSNRVVKLWSNLPEEVVMAPTMNCFKWRFDGHIADSRYSMEWKYGPAENTQWDNHPDITSTRQHNMKIGQQAFSLQRTERWWWWSFCCRMLNDIAVNPWTRYDASTNSNKETKTVSIDHKCCHFRKFRMNFRLNLVPWFLHRLRAGTHDARCSTNVVVRYKRDSIIPISGVTMGWLLRL